MLFDQQKPKDTEQFVFFKLFSLSLPPISYHHHQGKVVCAHVLKIWDGAGIGPLIHSVGMRWGEW
jgi:hypothetical protein